ncbi:AAA family ATPase [Rhizobiales bacterium]|uniref:ATP-dependent nuclease n=1 Tax=Hongsoonwoonella zoysiae TaxID=2821844 RepID=UPI0015605E5C|nr:ATP-binding protein [Hongsoonwoonella zoysiae]NRG19154.1 AAA family ATPase [Hongsoonwoonella zoysiae]
MSRIRKVEIENFRGIQNLSWLPSNGINCLIGPGDSGKSTILDAIDYCLGARRNLQMTDADFHNLDVDSAIQITLTIGALDDALKSMDSYGMFLRGFTKETGVVEDEPEKDAETVLTLRLRVEGDLEPSWSLVSDRAEAQGLSRNLSWADRARLAPTRIGAFADLNLGWRRGSVLNHLTEERADASAAIVKAAREARAAFGDDAKEQLGDALKIVADTAKYLGIPVGDEVKAMLDAHSVSVSGGTISLHNEAGVPLKGLGIGSTRLLIAGLQRMATQSSSIILIDELEHGLEPHRIMRLLGSLGAKEADEPLQAFLTTHSPVALRELGGHQLFVVRGHDDHHDVLSVGSDNAVQGTIRLYPDAFLATSVIVCEGASEVGFLRGLDQYFESQGQVSIPAHGVALVDAKGGGPNDAYHRATPMQSLGYRTAILRDDDQKPESETHQAFIDGGGSVFTWRDDRCLEAELFMSLSDEAVGRLVDFAIELHGEDVVDGHIRSRATNGETLNDIQIEALIDGYSPQTRAVLAMASSIRKKGWFKQLMWMEQAAREIIGPDLQNADADFKCAVAAVFGWAGNAGT